MVTINKILRRLKSKIGFVLQNFQTNLMKYLANYFCFNAA